MRRRTRQADTDGQNIIITALGDSSGHELPFVKASRAWRVDNISGAVLEVAPPPPPRCGSSAPAVRWIMQAPSVWTHSDLSDAEAQLGMMKYFPTTSNLLRLT